MKPELRKELPTFGLLALFTVLLFANLAALEYFEIETPFEFNGEGLGILLLMFTAFLFLVMAVFGYRQYELKFQEKTSVAILLINNSLLILAVGFWLYMLFSAIAISLLIDAFYDGFLEETQEANFGTSIQILLWSAPFIMLFFVSFEIFLISKLRKINRQKS